MNTGKNLFAKLQNADSPRGIWENIDAGREYLRKCDSAERGWPPSLSVPVHWAPRRVTRESALRRNELIAALADEACIAYAASGGYTERIVEWLKSWCVPPFVRTLINHEVHRSQ